RRPPAVAATPAPVPAPAPSAQAARQGSSATKTIFGMPAAEVMKARAASEAARAAADSGKHTLTSTPGLTAPSGPSKAATPAPGVMAAPAPASAGPAPRAAAPATTGPVRAETTEPVRRYSAPAATLEKPRPAKKETSIVAYVGVGITFGVALLGIYHLVGLL